MGGDNKSCNYEVHYYIFDMSPILVVVLQVALVCKSVSPTKVLVWAVEWAMVWAVE
jgi:hypothetical protein